MKLINGKYRQLYPTTEYFGDQVVMAQAWKKTHAYIRTHNWYADTLALDVSALSLEGSVQKWAQSAVDPDELLNDMELVPAAKSDAWVVDPEQGWVPDRTLQTDKPHSKPDKIPLRPLAHLSVRDQTWATAAMLCMADIVESKQGDCSGNDVMAHQRRNVYSYGNRLVCDWKEEGSGSSAWFRWGNSEIYRKFFSDYQSFLRRPVTIGREISQGHTSSDLIYVVNLDLSKFYDNIDRKLLLKKLKNLCSNTASPLVNSSFWSAFEKISSWRWSSDDHQLGESLGLELKAEQGLPQGLVSAGFYANAYMIDFDDAAGECVGSEIPMANGLILYDYCRYVDDLRLVVSIEKKEQYSDISKAVVTWLNKLLSIHAGEDLSFNSEKTAVIALSDLDNKGSLSERVAQLQSDLSGPADRDLLDSSMAALEGLLSMSEESVVGLDVNKPDAALVKLAKFDHDVRSDTLKRFAANRLETIMRNKRKVDVGAGLESIQEIDNQSELLAKKLIWAWMKDPSLALVLRKALEIYPSTDIAEPVFDAIYRRCSFSGFNVECKVSSTIMNYLIADLFRSCIDFHGYFQRVEYPRSCNPDQLLELACRYAQKTLSGNNAPAFVERQALLLLAIKQKPAPTSSTQNSIQHHLHSILAGRTPPWNRQRLALYEVATQITGIPDSIVHQFIESAESLEVEEQKELLVDLAKRGGSFWASIWRCLAKSSIDEIAIDAVSWAEPTPITQVKSGAISLDKLLAADENPFVHETALIKLALKLLDEIEGSGKVRPLPPSQIRLKKSFKGGWGKLWRLDAKLSSLEFVPASGVDPRFELPEWLDDSLDAKAIYYLGCILRSSAVGASDFTGSRWKTGKVQSYKGLRTGWYKRRMGMMHAPETLVGEFSTLSSWSAELLMKCLQWPGFESTYLSYTDISNIDSILSLKEALKERQKLLRKWYCEAIDTPALITRAERPKSRHEKGFRLVSVQQLLPRTSDFSKADPKLDSVRIKAENRDHLSRICQLTYRTLQANLAAEGKEGYPGADLIVFPELAVHPDDQDLVKRLADKTQSIIFAGLGLQDHEGQLINVARWFIPDYRDSGRQWIIRDQGKQNPTRQEIPLGVKGYRPCQHVLEILGDSEGPFYLSGAICYDSTDLKLAADLTGKTDLFIIAAHNKDVRTFDTMASALNYHMYQHVVVVNKGEFGGSTIQAPYREQYDRMISHAHGTDQISINVADLDLAAFRRKSKSYKSVKAKPAGLGL